MLVPIKWLNEFIVSNKNPKELAELFTSKGIEVNSITKIGEKLEGFIVAEVKSVENNKITLFDGKNTTQISAIAYHLKPGDKIASHAKNLTLLNPMLIGISEDTLPYILNKEYTTSTLVLDYLDDYILDLEILPNRGDLMSVIGIARELASYEEISAPFHLPVSIKSADNSKYKIADELELEVINKDGCPDYIARLICDLKIEPSPFWLQWRLIAVGLRPINNIVDATNYIMVKYGTPLHAFDYDKILDHTIQVRFGKKGEKIKTIDNTVRNIDEHVLLIADKKLPIAIAGIMGGSDTEISMVTKRVVLECARFDSKTIRRSSKKLNLSTEASQRFEMGIDSAILETASAEVSNLIAELGKGILAKGKLETRTQDETVSIKIAAPRASQLLGIRLETKRVQNILQKLNCTIDEKDSFFTVEIPSYRLDLKRDVDLIEEIGRIHGYDKLPNTFSLRGSLPGTTDALTQQLTMIKDFFVGLSFTENYTVSFCDEITASKFTDKNIVRIQVPLNERFTVLRPSLLPTLLESVKTNFARGNKNLRLFEIGKVFNQTKEILESTYITALISGQNYPTFWRSTRPSIIDFFDIKGIAELFIDYLKIKDINFSETNSKYLTAGNAVGVKYADTEIGYLGEIKKTILSDYDIPVPVYAFEFNLDEILKLTPSYRCFQPLPRFPSVIRDFAFIVDDRISTADMIDTIEKVTGALLEQVEIFDYFKGKPLAAGKRNLGIRITLRSEERTLKQEEVNKIFDRIINHLKDKMKIELRSEDSDVS